MESDKNRLQTLSVVLGLVLATISCGAAILVVPEIRAALGLGNPTSRTKAEERAARRQGEGPDNSSTTQQTDSQAREGNTSDSGQPKGLPQPPPNPQIPVAHADRLQAIQTEKPLPQEAKEPETLLGSDTSQLTRTRTELDGFEIVVRYRGLREDEANAIKQKLSSLGIKVTVNQDVPTSDSDKWNRLYFPECHEEEARILRDFIGDISRFTLMHSKMDCSPTLDLVLFK